MTKRNIFAELMEGFDALESERAGKVTLKKVDVDYKPAPKLTAAEVVKVRTNLKMSQPVFARRMRIEVKTVANWEQGRSRPNAQASILLKLVEKHPELLGEIAAL
jgi:putative transcriptional regulator